MDTRKVYLQENKDVNSVNEQSFVGVDLSTRAKLLPYNDVSEVLNLNNLYTEERNSCRKFRLILTVNPICTNVLFNYRTEVVRYEGSSAATMILGEVEPAPPVEYGLSVNPSSLNFLSGASSSPIIVHAENQGWTINDIPDWIQIDKNSGQDGDTEVLVSVYSNEGESGRTYTLNIFGTNEGECTVEINQTGLGYGLIVTPDLLEFPNTGGSQNITINAINQDWEIINIPEWVTLSTTTGVAGDTIVRVEAGLNSEGDKQDTFIVQGLKGGEQQTVTVLQTAKELVRIEAVILNAPDIPASGGSVQCDTPNVNYQVTAYYSDETSVPVPTGQYEIIACTGVTAQSKGKNADNDRTPVDELYATLSYNNKEATSNILIYQEQNVLSTSAVTGTTQPIQSSWTESSDEYYTIDVIPSAMTVPATGGSFNVTVEANSLISESSFTQNHWFDTLTPYSSYTAMGDEKFYGETETGTTPHYEEIEYQGATVIETPMQVEPVGTVYQWITATTSTITYDTNPRTSQRSVNVKYKIVGRTTPIDDCSVTQEGNQEITTRKIHIVPYQEAINVTCHNFNNIYENGSFEITGENGWTGTIRYTGSYMMEGVAGWTPNNGTIDLETNNMQEMVCTFYFKSTNQPGPFDATGSGFFGNLNQHLTANVPMPFTYTIPAGQAGDNKTIYIGRTTETLTFNKTQ